MKYIPNNELDRLNELAEMKGLIIDVFEDFLDSKGIVIENPERDLDENLDPEDSANIFGSDYDWLGDKIEALLKGYGVLDNQVSISTPAGDLVAYVGDSGEARFAGVMLKPQCRLDKGEDTEVDIAYVETQSENLRENTDLQADDVVIYTYADIYDEDYTNKDVIRGEDIKAAMEDE